MIRGALIALALALPLACGETSAVTEAEPSAPSASSAATSSPSAAGTGEETMECVDVWIEGADLPRRYQGCLRAGELVRPEVVECSSGQRIVTFDDQFWALRGYRISYASNGLLGDEKYEDALRGCRA
jgi:hypothetical protein